MRAMQLAAAGLGCAIACSTVAAPVSERYRIERIVEPSAFHGVHGLAFDKNDHLFAGSVSGQAIYSVDTRTGKTEVVVGAPEGNADDLVFLADGTMVWTSISLGIVHARKGNGPVRVLAEKLPSINSINVRKTDGRLFAAQVFGGNDGVWEIDPNGVKPPRSIVKDVGGFNGFDVGPDGALYGPSWFKKQLLRIDPDSGEVRVIADGFGTPAAANFDSKWNLYVLDTAYGQVVKVDIKSGSKQVVAKMATSLDNLAIDSHDRIFVSNMADNAIHEVNPRTGAARAVVQGKLAFPRAIGAASDGDKDRIYVADNFAFRSVDGATGKVTDIGRSHAANTPIGYAGGVSVNAKHILLTNSNGTLQRYDRRDNQVLDAWTELRAQNALELADGSIIAAITARGILMHINAGHDADERTQRTEIATGLDGPYGLAPAGANAFYFSEMRAGRISRFDLATRASKPIVTGLDRPYGIALDSDGSIIVLELGPKRLIRVSPENGAVAVIATDLPLGIPGVTNYTAGVASGSSGRIYFSSDVENSLYRMTPRN